MAITGPNEASTAVALQQVIAVCFAALGFGPVEVLQNFQPTQQGQQSGPVLYFHRFPEKRYGWPQRKDVYDPIAEDFTHEESTQFEVTYQFNALTDPVDPTVQPPLPTATEILRAASWALQSDRGQAVLRAAGLGVLRVTALRLSYDLDERDQNEPEPSFDVVLTYRNTFTDRVGLVTETELEIFRV